MSPAPTPEFDLHKTPIATVWEAFDDEEGYLERVTVTDEAEAVRLFCEDWSVEPNEIEVRPIHMRYTTEDPDPVLVPELPCWLKCEADHPDAVPFWSAAAMNPAPTPGVPEAAVEALRESLWATWGRGRQTDWPTRPQLADALTAALSSLQAHFLDQVKAELDGEHEIEQARNAISEVRRIAHHWYQVNDDANGVLRGLEPLASFVENVESFLDSLQSPTGEPCERCGGRREIEREAPHQGTEEDDWILCPDCQPPADEGSGEGEDDRGIEGVKARLAEQRDETERLQSLLAGARCRRDALIQKLGHAGLSERAIAPIAGVSNVAVHNVLSSGVARRALRREAGQ